MPEYRAIQTSLQAAAALALTAILAACQTPPPAPPPVKVAAQPAEPRLPVEVKQALAERFPEHHLLNDTAGLLPTPGVDELAVVLVRNDDPGTFEVALVEPDGKGGWRVADTSRPISPGCDKCSVSADLAPHGLYVRVIRAEGGDFENLTYQFAPGAGTEPWRLVGVTAYIPARADDPSSHAFAANVDLLTGQRIDVVDEAGASGPVHRERQSTVPLRAPIAFGDFAFTADALDAETRKLAPVQFDPAGRLPAVAVDALRERFPQMTVQSQASGSLRGESGRDIVAVLVPVDRAARAGAAADAVVAVLLAQPDGSVKLADVSAAMPHDHPTRDVQVQIARRTLSVQTKDVDATGSVAIDYQFAFRPRDTLRLSGLRTETTVRSADNANRRTVVNTNLISGDRVETVDGVVNGRRARSEQKTRLAVPSPIRLTDFAFDPASLGDDLRPDLGGDAGGTTASAAAISGS